MSARAKGTATRVQPSQVAALQEVSLSLTRRIRKYSETELTLSQMSALSTLRRVGPMRVGDLARREHISKSSVTRLVAKLEDMGYLERHVDPTDGRSYVVTMTEHGHDQHAASQRRASEFLTQELGRISDQDRTALLEALPALQALTALRH